ncbi:MAG: hypothetical protein LH481_16100 [Burkholderiales bacterium]|nr:hypothetical protein [Burkholderiales bacterium]
MPKTEKTVPLSREMEQRERETTEQSLINDKSKVKRGSSTGGKRPTDKQAGGRKGHQ